MTTSTRGSILLGTKLQRPPLPRDPVVRPRLLARLDAGLARKLAVVSAPAGFGKTTLVASCLASLEAPGPAAPLRSPDTTPRSARSAWLSLDATDDSLPGFLGYLIAAVHRYSPVRPSQPSL